MDFYPKMVFFRLFLAGGFNVGEADLPVLDLGRLARLLIVVGPTLRIPSDKALYH